MQKINDSLLQARAFFQQQRLEEAFDCCAMILDKQPNHAEAHYILGNIYCQLGHLEKGSELLVAAVESEPDNIHFLNSTISNLMVMNRLTQAHQLALRLIQLEPQIALYWDTLGLLFRRLDDHKEAVKYFRKAVQLEPNSAEYLYNLGTSQRFMGDFDKAEENYEKALDIDPNHYHTHFSLSEFSNITPQHNHIKRLQKLLSENQSNSLMCLFLSYALYKEYDTLGEFEKGFEILKKGNAVRSRELNYPVSEDEKVFSTIKKRFANEELSTTEGYSNNEAIFVLGMPRSGTTLVDRIISSHSEVMSAGELQSFGVLLKQASKTQTNKVLDPATIEAAFNIDFAALGKAYIDSTRPVTGSKAHFIDKMPINFYYIGYILKALPKAKIICLDRNPMDTCIGNFRQLFAANLPYYQYSYDLIDTGKYYLQFQQLMEFWKSKYGDRILIVNYEELVQQPKQQVSKILGYCDLEWQDDCLQFHKNKAPVSTASSVQVRQPINTKYIGRWKKYQNQVKELAEFFDKVGVEYQ